MAEITDAVAAVRKSAGFGATGLRIQAMLDTNTYEKGIKITDQQMKTFEAAHLQRHEFHGGWNYTVNAPAGNSTTRPN